MVVKGTAYEYYFRNAANDDLVKKKIWKERMEPYIDDPDYATVGISNIFKWNVNTINFTSSLLPFMMIIF